MNGRERYDLESTRMSSGVGRGDITGVGLGMALWVSRTMEP